MKFACIILLGFLFISCSSSKGKPLQNYMIGHWQTEYIRIEMTTVNKSDSVSVFEDDISKPKTGRAQSNYKKDGTFSVWFKTPEGKRIGETNGNWHTKSDSLYVDYFYSGKQVQAWYLITKTSEGFNGKAIYDWDSDGEFDDTLFMKTKRLDLE